MDTHQDEINALAIDDAAQAAINRQLQGPPVMAHLFCGTKVFETLIYLSGRMETLCERDATNDELSAPSVFDEFAR